uniref:Zinc finger BED domain-containing protein RICESLEEPER 2-like n=1 Tax=Tanacetum cinerariifolium TaxID=118510 RepID=A0A6L2KQQ8_TANCI|nr:zinc finger BED domain-containing protein RICESLEEPER 2-like [Tanacetum cinerariifolium]
MILKSSIECWWKRRSPAFPVLSLVARDILAIPISTVASESTISTGGRALDSFRSSLSSETVQALICYQDWVRSFDVVVNLEENIDDLEKFEDDESIDIGFAKCNTIVTSLKALHESFSSKKYVRKILRSIHPKWRAKVTAIEKSKDLSSLSLDELIGNLEVHEMIMKKDSELVRSKREKIKSLVLNAKKEFSDDETSMSGSKDEEYDMAIRDFKKFFNKRGGYWSDSGEENEEGTNDETCLVAQPSNEAHSNTSYSSNDNSSIDDNAVQNEQVRFVKSTENESRANGSHKERDGFLKDKETVAPSAAEEETVSNLNHNLTSKPKH